MQLQAKRPGASLEFSNLQWLTTKQKPQGSGGSKPPPYKFQRVCMRVCIHVCINHTILVHTSHKQEVSP